jgi:hypothetical protein
MNPHKVITLLLAPVIGMMPFVAFCAFDCFWSYPAGLLAALAVYVLYFVIPVALFKQEVPYTLLISTLVFLIVIGFSFIPPFNLLYAAHASIVLELVVIPIFFLFLRLRAYFQAKLIHGKDAGAREFLLLKFDSNIYAVKIALFLVAVHLWVVLVYQLFPENYHTVHLDRIIYYYILFLLIALHYLYEGLQWSLLNKQIRQEEWLPIVDESGSVHGKIAMSVSHNNDKYLHPIIRIALIHKGMLFLKQQTNESRQLDYPFKRYLRFRETLEEGVKEAFIKNGGTADLSARFVFRYIYPETNRLVYLYACNIPDEKTINDLHLEEGKWWTSKQIDDNLNTGLFSSYFEKEYEFLNTTILMADRLMTES